jgi:hypothetical protein
MPANLSPEYKKAEAAFREAKNAQEKIIALEHMLAVIPKHKGTEKMQGDIKKRLSKLSAAEEKSAGKRSDFLHVKRDGAGQAAVVGHPNSGKSLIIKMLTAAEPEVGDYPFTTIRPNPYMMPYEDILIQLVDTGPVDADRIEPYHINLIRNADLILPVLDLGAPDPNEDFDELMRALAGAKIDFVREMPDNAPEFGVKPKRTLVIVNKYDLDEDDILFDDIKRRQPAFDLLPVSAKNGTNIEALREAIFQALDVCRVYSKIPGKPPDMNCPYVMPRGSTVIDVARTVHKEVAENLRYARIWGSERFDGQKVQRDYKVHDKDIIELHT